MPVAQKTMVRRVLLHGADLTGDEIAKRIPGCRGGGCLKGEDPEVIQVSNDHIFIQRQLAAEIERVFALGHGDQIAYRIKVRGGYRPCERSANIEISRHV